LERGRALLEEGWRANDLARIKEAKGEADAAGRGASAGVKQQVAAFQREVEQRLRRAEKNRALLVALLDVALPHETSAYVPDARGRMMALAQPSVEEQYAAAFRRWGLDLDASAEAEVVARLRDEPGPVLEEVIAALDIWKLDRRSKKRPWRRLLRLAEQLDRTARRRQLREMLTGDGLLRAEEAAGLMGALRSAGHPWAALAELERVKQRRLVRLRDRMRPETDPVPSVILLAEACRRAGGAAVAEGLLRQALAARPDQVGLLSALGHLLEQQGASRLGEAIERYRAGRARQPRLGITLGVALVKAGRALEGEEVLRDLIRQQPNNPETFLYLGNALAAQKKVDQAWAAWSKAVRLRPDFPQAHNNLGTILAERKKWAEAETAFRRAIQLQPGVALPWNNLGWALHKQKKRAEAEAACRKAIQIEPDHAEAHCHLGAILQARGKPKESLAAIRRGHELGLKTPHWRYPSAVWVRQAERIVKLERKLLAPGEGNPASAVEQLELAQVCLFQARYAASARFYRDAFAADARLAEGVPLGVRSNAACAAALAACRQGQDAGKLDDQEGDHWRQQALNWLRVDLTWWGKALETVSAQGRTAIAHQMQRWQSDPDLAGVRDRAALAKLPLPQRTQWLKVWADVEALRRQAGAP
jgi:Tfp pilus assembly protein PilF